MNTMLIIATLIVLSGPNQTEGYKGIVPVKSSRADVERLFGTPTDQERQIYYFQNEIVRFQYSNYACTQPPVVKGWPTPPLEGWNVPPNTVLVIRVNFRKQVPLSSLGIDLKSFKKVRGDRDVASHFQYVDEEAGLTIDLNGDGTTETVRGLIYEPAAKYKSLRCSAKT
jgi:hypothetical protein